MAIKDSYPSISPTLDLNFAGTRTVDPRITFSRASTATYFDEFGVMRTAPTNTPRIVFDPATGECKGLLMEEQRTNLLTYSEQFDNAAWVKQGTVPNNSTVLANASVAPDGTLTADKLIEMPSAAGSGMHGIYRFYTVPSGAITLSFYAKAAERYIVCLSAYEGSVPANPVGAYFNLSTGAVTSTSGLTTNATITPVGNGWYRCTVSGVSAGTASSWSVDPVQVSGQSSYTGDGTSGIYIWGAQLEVGAFPTSYIKTEASQATRAADSAAMTGSNFSSWYRLDEGTIYCEAEYFGPNNADATTTGIVTLGDGTSSNFLSLVVKTDNKSSRASFANELIANTSSNSYIENTVAKFTIGYKNLDCVFSKDGGVLTGNNSINTIPFNQLVIGAYYMTSSRRLNGRIKRISFYPKRVSNTNDQALTT